MSPQQKITPCLWFEGNAEEAVSFYTSVFANSSIDHVQRSPTDYPGGKEGSALLIKFTLAGLQYLALNGGPYEKFTNAMSLSVDCEDQAEVDRLWVALTADGGEPLACGWLKDKYGLPWQIVPRRLPELLTGSDTAKAKRVMEAMMQMVKIDVAALEAAALEERAIVMIEAPEITHTQRQTVAVTHVTCPRDAFQPEVNLAIREILAALTAANQQPVGPMFMHHLTMSKSQFDVEVGFPISAPLQTSGRVKTSALPAARVARTIYHGPYEMLFAAWDEFGKRLARDGLVDAKHLSPIGTLWERYLVGPETTSDQRQWRTELNLPLAT
jgi:predicted 3-demethylubiquinone-9 3-methyltransferase (glyoxalase superfamily)/effector-binding domain-containing protein